jgi:hypothetical protein
MKNKSLKSYLKSILENQDNISKVEKSSVSNFSIGIHFTNPQSYSSYIYYENEIDRDSDYDTLNNLTYIPCQI